MKRLFGYSPEKTIVDTSPNSLNKIVWKSGDDYKEKCPSIEDKISKISTILESSIDKTNYDEIIEFLQKNKIDLDGFLGAVVKSANRLS